MSSVCSVHLTQHTFMSLFPEDKGVGWDQDRKNWKVSYYVALQILEDSGIHLMVPVGIKDIETKPPDLQSM